MGCHFFFFAKKVRALWSTFAHQEFDKYQRVGNVHVVAAALKLWLREQSEPIFPFAVYDDVIASQKTQNGAVMLKEIIEKRLPPLNRDILHSLILLLRNLLQHESTLSLSCLPSQVLNIVL